MDIHSLRVETHDKIIPIHVNTRVGKTCEKQNDRVVPIPA